MTNTTTYEKLTSDNGKQRIFLKWHKVSKFPNKAKIQVQVKTKDQNRKTPIPGKINLDQLNETKTKLKRKYRS